MRESNSTTIVAASLDDAMEIISSREEMFGSQSAKPNPADTLRQKKAAYVEVVEQPAGKGLRFRYECEGRSAGSIPGATSTIDNRTCPTIKVHGYSGRAVVVVSCVTADPPYRPHPHNLVGKEGCKKGVCTLELGPDMTCSFPSLGIQCVKKKDIEESLTLRQQIRVDPFQTGFSHATNASGVDLNCLRLAFQVFLEGNDKGAFTFALKPVVSDPIYDKKSKCDLTICRLTETSGPVAGGKEILLFCEKITKDDIQVRFFEEENDELVWEAFGDFQPSDVHKQYGICFRTPKYRNIEIESPVQVQLQLRRPSDGGVSAPRTFEFLPLDAGRAYWSAKRLKTNYSLFNQILSADQAVRSSQEATSPLRHKVRSDQPSQLMETMLPVEEIKEETPGCAAVSGKQLLRPVAMPGAFSLAPITQPGGTYSRPVSLLPTAVVVGEAAAIQPLQLSPQPPPAVPVRSPHKSSLLQTHLLGQQQPRHQLPQLQQPNQLQQHPLSANHQLQQLPSHQPHQQLALQQPQPSHQQALQLQLPQAPLRHQLTSSLLTASPSQPRPISDLSLGSDLSQFTENRGSLCTQQSINEVLSLAEFDLDNVSVNTFLMELPVAAGDGKLHPLEGSATPMMSLGYQHQLLAGRQLSEYLGGSLSSVTTVKEIRPTEVTAVATTSSLDLKTEVADEGGAEAGMSMAVASPSFSDQMDLDIGQIYDDVMQCVYDDVDTKYDDITATLVEKADAASSLDPPVPPLRKRGLSIDKGVDRPLPTTPRNPTIIDKIAEKKNELMREREREAERKRAQEEAKRREREAAEEARRAEREEKEKRKLEERERRRLEEEQKRSLKRKEEEERKAGASSLFQRLFQRTVARTDDEGSEIDGPAVSEVDLETPPPVPAHASPESSLGKVSVTETFTPVPDHQVPLPSADRKNLPTYDGYDDFTAQLADVEQTIRFCDTSANVLQRLDSVVNEFASQFPVEAPVVMSPTGFDPAVSPEPGKVQTL